MWCVFKLGLSYAGKCNQTVIEIKKKELSLKLNSLILNSRDDKIRTCDHTPPRGIFMIIYWLYYFILIVYVAVNQKSIFY